jgi:hypothetical protein
LKRSAFISGVPRPSRPIVPAIGQRWFYNVPEEKFAEKHKDLEPSRREMMVKIRESSREFGYVIIGEHANSWILMRKPVNPHPKSRPHLIKKEWLVPSHRFGGHEDIGDAERLIFNMGLVA